MQTQTRIKVKPEELDRDEFSSAFGSLQTEFKQKFGRDFRITGTETKIHQDLHGSGRARDIGGADLSDDEGNFVVDRGGRLGLDVRDFRKNWKEYGGSGPHIHVDYSTRLRGGAQPSEESPAFDSAGFDSAGFDSAGAYKVIGSALAPAGVGASGRSSRVKVRADEVEDAPAFDAAGAVSRIGAALSPAGMLAGSVDVAAHTAATSPLNDLREPSEKMKEQGNYAKGHTRVGGLDIAIENPAGSTRRPKWPALKSHYGYFKRSSGGDGENVNVFVKPGTQEDYSGPVFVVDQNNEKGKFDEHKVMLGFDSEEAARAGYLENYTPGWSGLGAVRSFGSPSEFKDWLNKSDTTKPAAPGRIRVRPEDVTDYTPPQAPLGRPNYRESEPITEEMIGQYQAFLRSGGHIEEDRPAPEPPLDYVQPAPPGATAKRSARGKAPASFPDPGDLPRQFGEIMQLVLKTDSDFYKGQLLHQARLIGTALRDRHGFKLTERDGMPQIEAPGAISARVIAAPPRMVTREQARRERLPADQRKAADRYDAEAAARFEEAKRAHARGDQQQVGPDWAPYKVTALDPEHTSIGETTSSLLADNPVTRGVEYVSNLLAGVSRGLFSDMGIRYGDEDYSVESVFEAAAHKFYTGETKKGYEQLAGVAVKDAAKKAGIDPNSEGVQILANTLDLATDPTVLVGAGELKGMLPASKKISELEKLSKTERAVSLLNAPKTLKSSGDLSAVARQGIFFNVTNPKESATATKNMLRSFTKKGYEKVEAELATHPKAWLAEDAGLYQSWKADGVLSKTEEAWLGSAALKDVPVLNRYIDFSERTFTSFLDSQRLEVFSAMADELIESGKTFATHPREFKDIARFVNWGTGRGSLGKLDEVAPMLNTLLFSPRLMASRFQVVASPLVLKGQARQIAMRKLFRFTATTGAALGLVKYGGARFGVEVGTDPTSSDFAKIKIGETRFDFLGGFQQSAVFVSRLADSFKREAVGEEHPEHADPASIVGQFLRTKESPVVSSAHNLMDGEPGLVRGEDLAGEKRSLKLEKGHRFEPWQTIAPMFLEDMRQAWQQENAAGVAKVLPAGLGVGVRTQSEDGDIDNPLVKDRLKVLREMPEFQQLGEKDKTALVKDIVGRGREEHAQGERGRPVAPEVGAFNVEVRVAQYRALSELAQDSEYKLLTPGEQKKVKGKLAGLFARSRASDAEDIEYSRAELTELRGGLKAVIKELIEDLLDR